MISHLGFRRSIVIRYLSRYGEVTNGAGRPKLSKYSSIDSGVVDDVRIDGSGHLI